MTPLIADGYFITVACLQLYSRIHSRQRIAQSKACLGTSSFTQLSPSPSPSPVPQKFIMETPCFFLFPTSPSFLFLFCFVHNSARHKSNGRTHAGHLTAPVCACPERSNTARLMSPFPGCDRSRVFPSWAASIRPR